MKILLVAVNAKYIHSNLALRQLKKYAEAHLESLPEIEIIEYTINNYQEDILSGIYERHPDVLMFSCYIWNWGIVKSLIADIGKVLPEVPVFLGGPEVSYDAENVLAELPQVAGVMIGEGEQTFCELVKHLEDRSDYSKTAGLYIRSEAFTPREMMPMDEVPFVYSDSDLKDLENRIIYYESSRGCPFACSYCLSARTGPVRFRSVEKVFKEMQFFLDHRVMQVKFVDRTFNADRQRAIQIWNYIKEHDNGVTNFHFEIEGDILSDKELDALEGMRPGLLQMEIGVQSTNPDTIREINRVMDFERLKRITRRVSEMKNIHQHLDLIAGLPMEDMESFQKSFNDVYSLNPDQLQLGFLKVLKGSPLSYKTKEYDLKYTSRPPYEVLETKWMSFKDILELKKIERMVELYYNSRQFTYTLRQLVKEFDAPFDMFAEIAAFYEDNGYMVSSPSRLHRYDVLLDFIGQKCPEKTELFRELLTFDLYLRENVKSRPAFAPDIKEYAAKLRLQSRDKENHLDVFWYSVWAEDPVRLETAHFVEYDYSHRDALNNNASISFFADK
ncbi:MAG: B12-binding domain-containing radical SAM protein [Lachnospiraceae bacterium]|nr:B12-binding domain-containing radical SAM protein [Lachnospiraceae bacterium]MBR6350024.1 B12-binding domain-containing radical SAM protein [Lachnospiraceae bacterium]